MNGPGDLLEKEQEPSALDGVKQKRSQPAKRGHGFYSSHFNRQELAEVSKLTSSLDEEIAMLRVISRRVFEFASENEPGSLQEWTKVLIVLGSLTSRIASLLKQSSTMENNQDDKNKTISQAIAEVVRELDCQ